MSTYKPRTKTVEAAQFTGYDSIHALVAIIGNFTVKAVTIQCEGPRLTFLESGSGICLQPHEWLVREDGALRVLTNNEFREKYESNGPGIQISSFLDHQTRAGYTPVLDLYGPSTLASIGKADSTK